MRVLWHSACVCTLAAASALGAQDAVKINVNWPSRPRILPDECLMVGVGKFKYRDENQKSKYGKHAVALNTAFRNFIRNEISRGAEIRVVGRESVDFWNDLDKQKRAPGRKARPLTKFEGAHIVPTLFITNWIENEPTRNGGGSESPEDLDAMLDLPLLPDR